MIDGNSDGSFDVSCDYCLEKEERINSEGNWQDMIEEAKERGWKIKKVNEEWKHMCPDCVENNEEW